MVEDKLLIELKDISFGYYTAPDLLDDLNFRLTMGERVGIIGPNGCGKTTLLYLIMGLLKPAKGEIRIFGKKRRVEEDFVEVRQRIGFLFQNSDDQLFCPSVKEEIAFGPLNFGVERNRVREIIDKTLKDVGLDGFEERAPYNLSGGEKRKLALATILAMQPDVLLLDEPTIGLDEATVEKLINILNEPRLSYIIISQNRGFLKETVKRLYTVRNRRLEEL